GWWLSIFRNGCSQHSQQVPTGSVLRPTHLFAGPFGDSSSALLGVRFCEILLPPRTAKSFANPHSPIDGTPELLMPTVMASPRASLPVSLWIVVVLMGFSAFLNYLDRGNLSIAAPMLKEELHISPVRLGFLLSAFFWTYGSFQLFSGWLVDRLNVKPSFCRRIFPLVCRNCRNRCRPHLCGTFSPAIYPWHRRIRGVSFLRQNHFAELPPSAPRHRQFCRCCRPGLRSRLWYAVRWLVDGQIWLAFLLRSSRSAQLALALALAHVHAQKASRDRPRP